MRSTRGRRVRVIAVAAGLLACAALQLGCIPVVVDKSGNVSLKTPPPKGSASTTSKPATTTISPAMVGTPLSAGSWKMVVLAARTSKKGPGGKRAAKGKEFLLLDTQVRNTKMQETLVLNPKDVSLKSASGKKIAMSGTTQGYNARGMRELGPGYGGFTVFSFQIPKGSSGYVFTFAPKVGDNRVKLQWGVP